MTDLPSLYAGICAQPDEDTPRLVLADFLDEQGGKPNQFRADLIRTHCQLAREVPWSPPWRELNARFEKLFQKVLTLEQQRQLPWLLHLKGRVRAWALERGLVGHLTLYSKRFVTEGDSYFEQDPIRSVKFVKLDSNVGTVKPEVLFACPHMGRIVKLDLDGSGLKDGDLSRLGVSPCSARLRTLALGGNNPFGATAVPKLLNATPDLTELSFFGNNQFGDAHAKALATCPGFARVRGLNLSLTPIGPHGVAALVSGKSARGLTALHLTPELVMGEYNTSLTYRSDRADGSAVAEAIAASTALIQLQELDLSYRNLGAEGLTRLVDAAAALPALRRLRLRGCHLTFTAVKALAESAFSAQLLSLDLEENANLVKHRAKLKKMFPIAHLEGPSAI